MVFELHQGLSECRARAEADSTSGGGGGGGGGRAQYPAYGLGQMADIYS